MAKYKDLQNTIVELEKRLLMQSKEIESAHKACDALDVPKSKSGAFVGHRLLWYGEGKRESFKTKENDQGYPPKEPNSKPKQEIKRDLIDELSQGVGAMEKHREGEISLPMLKDGELIKQ